MVRGPLDCVLLLHGEKPPEVNCRTLFCYIAVQVAVVPKHDSHNLYPHPLCHMESKPIKQSKLPLIFCFHQPGTVCVIQLSVHSIVDSEGVEYMYNSEDCTCVVQIIDHVRHGGVKILQYQNTPRQINHKSVRNPYTIDPNKYACSITVQSDMTKSHAQYRVACASYLCE